MLSESRLTSLSSVPHRGASAAMRITTPQRQAHGCTSIPELGVTGQRLQAPTTLKLAELLYNRSGIYADSNTRACPAVRGGCRHPPRTSDQEGAGRGRLSLTSSRE